MLSPLRLVAWGSLVLGGILLLLPLGRAITAIWQRFQPLNVWARYAEEASPFRRRRRTWGWLGTTLLVVLGLLLVVAGGGLLGLEWALQAYAPFVADEPAASVQCIASGVDAGAPPACTLTLNGAQPYMVAVPGVRWKIEGEVLAWDPVLERFGLRSGYRLLRLSAYDASGRANTISLPSAQGGLGSVFGFLDDRFRFVRAHPLEASGEATAGTLYELVMAPTGPILRTLQPTSP